MLVDLLGLAIFAKESSKDSHSAHPDHLLWHTGIASTPPLTDTHVSTLALGERVLPYPSARVNHRGLTNDVAILGKLADSLACYGTFILVLYYWGGMFSWMHANNVDEGEYVREFAIEISLDSLGSNQTFLLPHFKTLAARRF